MNVSNYKSLQQSVVAVYTLVVVVHGSLGVGLVAGGSGWESNIAVSYRPCMPCPNSLFYLLSLI